MGVKPGYKRTEVGVIPEEWGVSRLGTLTSKIGSGITPLGGARVYRMAGRPFVRSQNIGWGELLLDDICFIDETTHGGFIGTEIQRGDVFLNITGASIGRSAVANDRIIGGNVNQHVCIVRPEPALLDPGYLNSLLLSQLGQRQIDSDQAGGNRQGLNFSQIAAFQFPTPPLREQRAIATALSDVDALLTQLDRLIAKKRDIKQAAMQQLLTGKTRLPGFDGAWRTGTVGDVVEALEAGVSVNSMDDPPTPGAPSVLKTSAVSAGRFLPEECKRITAADIPRARINPLANTILISRMNTPDLVGEVAYVPVDHPWLFLPDRLWMTRLKPGTRVDARWLAYLLSSRAYQQQIKAAATGTSGSMKNISKDSLLSIPVPFPEHEEQTAIATLLSDLDAELAALEARRDKTRALKQGMMQELLTGRTRLI